MDSPLREWIGSDEGEPETVRKLFEEADEGGERELWKYPAVSGVSQKTFPRGIPQRNVRINQALVRCLYLLYLSLSSKGWGGARG